MAMGGIRLGLCSAVIIGLTGPLDYVAAQDQGGVTVQFDVSEQLEHQRRSGGVSTTQALTGFSGSYLTETHDERLSFSGGFDLRALTGSNSDGVETDFINPQAALSYGLEGAAASLTFSASYRSNDISFLRPLTDFIADDGTVDLPEDFGDLTGTGRRDQLSYSARMTFRDDLPLGVSVSVSGDMLRYQDTTDPDLTDSDQLIATLGLRFDVNPATQATLGFTHTQSETDGNGTSESTSIDGRVSFERPLGALSFGVSVVETSTGTQVGADVARDYALSEVALVSGDLGVTRTASGETVMTGALRYQQALPEGALLAQFDRSVSLTTDNEEDIVTSLSATYSAALSDVFSVSASAALAQSSEAGSETDVADVALQIGYDLTREWSLSAGVSRQWSSESGAATVTTDTLSVGLGRSFQWRY